MKDYVQLLYLMSTLGGATRAGGMITLRKMNRFVSSSDVVLWHGLTMVVVLIQFFREDMTNATFYDFYRL